MGLVHELRHALIAKEIKLMVEDYSNKFFNETRNYNIE